MAGNSSPIGVIEWTDLTVPDADNIRDFYQLVVGWTPSPVDMGGYNDYEMKPPGQEKAAAGICHARGGNAALPAQWLLYVNVANLQESIKRCESMGGKVITRYGSNRCVIQDPAGAVMMIGQA